MRRLMHAGVGACRSTCVFHGASSLLFWFIGCRSQEPYLEASLIACLFWGRRISWIWTKPTDMLVCGTDPSVDATDTALLLV
jgi:hypothetical protein